MQPKKYAVEFKDEAVKQVIGKAHSVVDVAKLAKEVVQQRSIAIRLACAVFSISESCYRYQSQLNAENEQIASWLIRLT